MRVFSTVYVLEEQLIVGAFLSEALGNEEFLMAIIV